MGPLASAYPASGYRGRAPRRLAGGRSTDSWVDPTPGRVRGGNGRFVAVTPACAQGMRRCGWCDTRTTSQWRVGPPEGSLAMSTLCNACGINYRRALAKRPAGSRLDLDRLAGAVSGPARPSIQKALKRMRAREAIAPARAATAPSRHQRTVESSLPGSPISPVFPCEQRLSLGHSPPALPLGPVLPPIQLPLLPPIATLLRGVSESPSEPSPLSWSVPLDRVPHYDPAGLP